MTRLIWRLEGTASTDALERWCVGAQLHLRYQRITLVWMQSDQQRRAYLIVPACPHCGPADCEHGCHRALLAQLMRTALPNVRLTPAPRIVAVAPAVQQVVALPDPHRAMALGSEAWGERWSRYRLLMTWAGDQPLRAPVLRVGVRLEVPTGQASPASLLAALGWRRAPLATWRARLGGQRGDAAPAEVAVQAVAPAAVQPMLAQLLAALPRDTRGQP